MSENAKIPLPCYENGGSNKPVCKIRIGRVWVEQRLSVRAWEMIATAVRVDDSPGN
jgi:hypothetical protein